MVCHRVLQDFMSARLRGSTAMSAGNPCFLPNAPPSHRFRRRCTCQDHMFEGSVFRRGRSVAAAQALKLLRTQPARAGAHGALIERHVIFFNAQPLFAGPAETWFFRVTLDLARAQGWQPLFFVHAHKRREDVMVNV